MPFLMILAPTKTLLESLGLSPVPILSDDKVTEIQEILVIYIEDSEDSKFGSGWYPSTSDPLTYELFPSPRGTRDVIYQNHIRCRPL